MPELNRTALHAVASPRPQSATIIAAIWPHLPGALTAAAIDTPLRQAHFLAQIAHESDGFATLTEYASGRAYEGRADLGNTRPGDGVRYKGRGLIQLTGRANYRRMGRRLGLGLEAEPRRAADPDIAVRTACAYWQDRQLNIHADRDDLVAITFAVNGGLNGLADRRERLIRGRAAMGRNLDWRPAPHPVLQRGARGPAVASLQYALRQSGCDVRIDGDFGPATERALRRFQTQTGLAADGIAGPAVRTALLRRPALASAHAPGDKPDMPLIKRSLSLAGHRTSLSLEPEFWDEIDRAIAEDGRSLAGLVAEIDEARGEDPLASSMRVWVLERLRAGR